MGAFGRHDDLLRQIPDDVMDRARKAGVNDVDWYAGRLTSSAKKGFSQVPPRRYEQLRREARARRDATRKQKALGLTSPFVTAFAWLRVWPRRIIRLATR
jgi:carbohydrate-binding DOMON domain-containing protein